LSNNLALTVFFSLSICIVQADFVDGNRTVVVAYGATLPAYIGGRFANDYMALSPGTNAVFSRQILATRAVANSSLLAGVNSFDGLREYFVSRLKQTVLNLLNDSQEEWLVFERRVRCKRAPLSSRAGATDYR
jgi:hypothetical protein